MVLPATLTLWILVQAYLWVNESIAEPINSGIRYTLVQIFASWPALPEYWGITPTADEIHMARSALALAPGDASRDIDIVFEYQAGVVKSWWTNNWAVRLIGLLVAIFAVYLAGRLVGGWVGRVAYRQLERAITSLPVIKKIYSWIKQIVDFLFSNQDKARQFRRVVAVEYPKKGIWSVGFQTGTSLRALDDVVGDEAITIFIPSSPTPFTGYTITVPISSTIELPLTVEEAIGFTISGGVLRPPSQNRPHTLSAAVSPEAVADPNEKT